MSRAVPPDLPREPGEPSNRWPWVALALGALIIVVAVVLFYFNRSSAVNINLEGTPTPNPVARASTASPGPAPTLVPPTLPASATLAPTPTAVPRTATPSPPPPTPTVPPSPAPPTPTPVVIVVTATPAVAAQPATPAVAAQPAAAAASPASAATPPSQPVSPSPTPVSGAPVSNPGGLGNTRQDLDATYGAPIGQTSNQLVAYRKNNFEFHVGFAPDINGRASLIAEMPQQSGQTLPLDQAQTQAHMLLPKDAQPPNPAPEGNNQFVVERYTSQSFAQAMGNGAPANLMIVYVKDAQGRITRWILGPGDDPNQLISLGT